MAAKPQSGRVERANIVLDPEVAVRAPLHLGPDDAPLAAGRASGWRDPERDHW